MNFNKQPTINQPRYSEQFQLSQPTQHAQHKPNYALAQKTLNYDFEIDYHNCKELNHVAKDCKAKKGQR